MKEIFLLGYNEEKEFQDFLQQMEKKFNIKIRCAPALVSSLVCSMQQKGSCVRITSASHHCHPLCG
jgi:hypothetical protein